MSEEKCLRPGGIRSYSEAELVLMLEEAQKLRQRDPVRYSWAALGRRFGVDGESIRRKLDEEFRRKRCAQVNSAHWRKNHKAPTPWVHDHSPRPLTNMELAERLREIPEDTRSLTGRLFGDPLPGRSALDRVRQS